MARATRGAMETSRVAYISGDNSCAGFGNVARTRALPRSRQLGLGPVARRLRGFEIALRARVRFEELTLAAQLALRGLQIRLGLAHVRRGVADVGRIESDERRSLADAIAQLRIDPHDAARDRREHVS